MPSILEIKETPNPMARKFLMNLDLSGDTPFSYSTQEEAQAYPAAKALFSLPAVSNVFVLGNMVTVNLKVGEDWDLTEPDVYALLEEYTAPMNLPESKPSISELESGLNDDIPFPQDFFAMTPEEQASHINLIFDLKVRPGLAGDGGGLDFCGIEGQKVLIRYLGACGDCPSSTAGTLDYIQMTLQSHAHPQLTIEQVS